MMQKLKNRDTRVQIVIVENGKYILIEHLAKKQNLTFWGLPGGGREPGESDEQAAIREAKEETGLNINLLPVKHEVLLQKKRYVYNRIVTFLAYPVSGEPQLGYEPEEKLVESYNYRLIGLKWQDFYKDDNLELFTKQSVEPIRELLASAPIKRKAGVLPYRWEDDTLKILMVPSKRETDCLIFPQGDVNEGEIPKETAKRKAKEKIGISIDNMENRGFFFHQSNGVFYRTDIFSALLNEKNSSAGNQMVQWIHFYEAEKLNLFRESKRFIKELYDELTS